MRLKIFLFMLLTISVNLYSQSPYTIKDQNLLKLAVGAWPYIGIEPVRPTIGYIPYDYIHDSYKREQKPFDTNTSRLIYELSTIEFHMTSNMDINVTKGTFSMPNMYFSIGKTFFYSWYLSITPFITTSARFSVFGTNKKPTGSIDLYDAGVEAVVLTRILFSMRVKAVNDINGNTFMLIPSVVDSSTANFMDTPYWYIPRVENEMGFRTGFIGYYYEISYSQGFSKDSSPISALARINSDYIKGEILYQYNGKSSLSPGTYRDSRHLIQASVTGRIPFLDKQIWLNLLGEYTWKANQAHYVRLELVFEWKMLNVAVRELMYFADGYKDERNPFLFEYALYLKFEPFSFGFQGSTDGRYYVVGRVVF